MLRLEIPVWPRLADRQPTESCWWHVARAKATRHRDPYRSRHRSPGPAKFLRDESPRLSCERLRQYCFRSALLRRTTDAPRLRPLPPGCPLSLTIIESGSFCIQTVDSRSPIAKKNSGKMGLLQPRLAVSRRSTLPLARRHSAVATGFAVNNSNPRQF